MSKFLGGMYFGGLVCSVLVRLQNPSCYTAGSIIYPILLIIIGMVIVILLKMEKLI